VPQWGSEGPLRYTEKLSPSVSKFNDFIFLKKVLLPLLKIISHLIFFNFKFDLVFLKKIV
jgi:hypothetical protein